MNGMEKNYNPELIFDMGNRFDIDVHARQNRSKIVPRSNPRSPNVWMVYGLVEVHNVAKVCIRAFLLSSSVSYQAMHSDPSEKCHIPVDIPYVLSDNNTKLNHLLNEGESFDYQCIHGYARMTNVTCIQGYLTPPPLCQPRRDRISFSISN